MKLFTEQEAKEIGIPLKLANDWAKLMQALWTFCIKIHKFLPGLKQGENEILFNGFRLRTLFVNQSFLQINLESTDNKEYFSMRYINDIPTVKIVLGVVITSLHYQNLIK